MKQTTSFTIGHPKIIHATLIAILADLQSTVIFTEEGQAIGWVHAWKKRIDFSRQHPAHLAALLYETTFGSTLHNYTITYHDTEDYMSTREWDIKTKFIYPPTPAPAITIDTEDQY